MFCDTQRYPFIPTSSFLHFQEARPTRCSTSTESYRLDPPSSSCPLCGRCDACGTTSRFFLIDEQGGGFGDALFSLLPFPALSLPLPFVVVRHDPAFIFSGFCRVSGGSAEPILVTNTLPWMVGSRLSFPAHPFFFVRPVLEPSLDSSCG